MNRVPAKLISIIKLKRKIYSPDDVNPPLTRVQLWPLGPRISLEFHRGSHTPFRKKLGFGPNRPDPPLDPSLFQPPSKNTKKCYFSYWSLFTATSFNLIKNGNESDPWPCQNLNTSVYGSPKRLLSVNSLSFRNDLWRSSPLNYGIFRNYLWLDPFLNHWKLWWCSKRSHSIICFLLWNYNLQTFIWWGMQ